MFGRNGILIPEVLKCSNKSAAFGVNVLSHFRFYNEEMLLQNHFATFSLCNGASYVGIQLIDVGNALVNAVKSLTKWLESFVKQF